MNKVLEIVPKLNFVPSFRLNPNILIPKEVVVQQTIGKPRAIQGAKRTLLSRRIIKNFNRTPAEDVFITVEEKSQAIATTKKLKRSGHARTDKRALDAYFDNYTEPTQEQKSKAWINSVVAELEQKDSIKKAERQKIINSYDEAAEMDSWSFCLKLHYS